VAHVTGAVAMWLSTHPTGTPDQAHAAIIEYSTKGVVGDPQGAPNRLLFRPKDPNVSSMSCRSDPIQTLTCTMTHAHASGAVSIRWYLDGTAVPAWNNRTSVQGVCGRSTTRVRVSITASNGTDAAEDFFPCEFNG
jgi:hypothetical protein